MFKVVLGLIFFVLGFNVGMEFIALLGAGLAVWGAMEVAKKKSAESRAFEEGYEYSFVSGKTGIAMSTERKLVKLKEKSNVKEYGFDMIRSWESNAQTGGNAVNFGGGVAGGLTAASANLSQNIANRNASGLFVYTKDLENVKWRVEMFNPKEQAKWMEIMQQCINDN